MSKYTSKEQNSSYARAYYFRNKETIKEKQRAYYLRNKDRILKRTSSYARRRKYNLSSEDISFKLEQQNNQCLICDTKLNLSGPNTHVDHDHSSGKVRGILCKMCNNGLGHFKDDCDLLNRAIQYLRQYET